jgi:hypothetical protein
MLYKVKAGESPARIASRFGVPVASLIGANPRKPTTVVAGQRTWRSLASGETVSVPVGVGVGFVGAPADAVSALIAAGSPCLQGNAALVCAAQAALGIGADGKWGDGTSAAARRVVPSAPAGCSPRPAWWAPAGQSNCVGLSVPTASAAGASGVTAAAAAAAAALAADPNYCANVGKSGTAVNTAVHNFKAAWNAANPGQAVPINTGKYEPVTAAALSSALGGQSVAPSCGAAPAVSPAITPLAVAPSAPAVSPAAPAAGAPSAVSALLTYDPCVQQNAAAVAAAQRALGQPVDGKYGADTSTAARRLVPGAPAGCSPRPAWWAPPGQSNAVPAVQAAPAASPAVAVSCPPGTALDPRTGQCVAIPAPPPAPSGGGGAPAPSGPTQPVVVAPKEGSSTGAIAAGAIGVVALVGVVAAASMGKGGKGTRGARGKAGHRGHKGGGRKSAHHKTHKAKRR